MRQRYLLLAAVAAMIPGHAFAQHADHSQHGSATAQPSADPHAGHEATAQEHSGHQMPADRKAAATSDGGDPHAGHTQSTSTEASPQAASEPADAHAGHAAATETDPHAAHAGHDTGAAESHARHEMPSGASEADEAETGAADPHAGHMQIGSASDADPHAGHTISTSAAPPISGPPEAAFSGPDNAADAFFGDAAMAQARRELGREHGALPAYRFLIDRLEAQLADGANAYLFDAQAWYGGDINKLWIKAEGENSFEGEFESVETQALWSHAIGPWFDLQTGLRHDFQRGDDLSHFVLGVQGLAPYWIEVDAAAFVSEKGDVTARIEAEHDARITQKLILQPRAELEFSLQDIPEAQIGAGLARADIGLRLRYEITPQFAPYVGLEHSRAFGDTRRLSREAGEDSSNARVVIGLRSWF